jgi:hypothetical protein
LQRAAQVEFDLQASEHPEVPDKIVAESQALWDGQEEALRGFVRAQYDATQEMFAREGVREITVYRGMAWRPGAGFREEPPSWVDDPDAGISLSAMSSFSVDPAEARKFAVNGAGGEGQGKPVVLAGTIPVERIIGTPRTGVGCLPEYEVVVLGGASDRFTVMKPYTPPPLTDEEVANAPAGALTTDDEFSRAVALADTDARRQELIERSSHKGGWGGMIPPEWRPSNEDPNRYDPALDNRPPGTRSDAAVAAGSIPADQIADATQFVDAIMDWFSTGRGGTERERELIAVYKSGKFTIEGFDPPPNWTQ